MDDLNNQRKTAAERKEKADNKEEMDSRGEGLANMDQQKTNQAENAEESGEAGVENEVVEDLKNELAEARKEAADTYESLLRATAEFENFKKRSQRQIEDSRKYANESLIKDLLSVVDNLERAINASADNLSKEESCMLEGIEMTLSEILKILKKYNVTPIEAQGEPFDPTYHEAVMQQESEEHQENIVINEFQKGFMLHDRVIRPSMVVVSKGGQDD